MPEGSISHSPYASAPSPDDARICTAINNGVPDKIPDLTWSKPDFFGLNHRIIRTFAIDRKKRPDRECIPCAICSGRHPKYLEGAVLWSSDGTLRIIGHKCARKAEHFGFTKYENMLEIAKQKRLDDIAWDWLYPNISSLKPLSVDLLLLSRLALFFDAQNKEFSHKLPDIFRALAAFAKRNNGQITVEEELSGSSLVASEISRFSNNSSESKYETVAVGTMHGISFFNKPRKTWARQVESCQEALAEVPDGEGDAVVYELMGRGDNEPTVTAAKTLRNLEIALRIADELADARRFFEHQNLSTLESWGRDTRNMLPFKVERFGQQIHFTAKDLSRAKLNAQCPQFPDLSLLRRVVDAGGNLAGLLRSK
jgi:hypothetical protein